MRKLLELQIEELEKDIKDALMKNVELKEELKTCIADNAILT